MQSQTVNFNLTLHTIDNWGYPQTGIVMGNNTGTVNIQNANYDIWVHQDFKLKWWRP
jgi:hypothetical protein